VTSGAERPVIVHREWAVVHCSIPRFTPSHLPMLEHLKGDELPLLVIAGDA
jgi:hypothetical protein